MEDKKIVFIVKPDFVNKKGMLELNEQLKEYKLHVHSVYRLPDFETFSRVLRRIEIGKANMTPEEKAEKHRVVFNTIDAYKQRFIDFGMVVIVDNIEKLPDREFWQRGEDAKRNIRNKYVKQRDEVFYVIENGDGTKRLEEGLFSEKDKWEAQYGKDKISVAMFNGVHFEEYEEYLAGHTINMLKELNVIKPENSVKKVPYINYYRDTEIIK